MTRMMGPRATATVPLNKKALKRLFTYVTKAYPIHCIVVVIGIILTSIANVASSVFMKTLIDSYITPLINVANPDFAPLFNALTKMAMLYGIGILAAFIYQKVLVVITQGVMERLRNDMFAHMQNLPINYFDTRSHGDIMSLYTNDIDTLRQVISQSIPQFISAILMITGVLISMIVLSIPLTIVSLSMVWVMQKFVRFISSKSRPYFIKQQQNLGKENGYIEEMMSGAKVVKAFTYEQRAINQFKQLNDELFDSSYNANRFANILMPVMASLGNLSYVVVATVGAIVSISFPSLLSIGTLASFLQLNKSFVMPMAQVANQLNAVISALAGAERIFDLLDEEVEVDEGQVTLVACQENNGKLEETNQRTGIWAWKHPRPNGDFELIPLKGDVIFHDVDFGYTKERNVLHNINLYADSGQKLAFVGATGAGKTSITNLINRFYEINKGSITYDGIDVRLIKKDDLRRSLGIVLQETNLFTMSIKDNIRYGKPDATDEDVINAAKLANAHEFIMHLEDGYDTILTGSGSSLSQGQRQLLSIARAALADCPVLILDEATSSIDSRTEKIVQTGMDRLMKGRTVFVIAHRLSTIKNSDVIMVLDQGKIIERGNHDSLMKEKGIYYQLSTGALLMD